MADIEVLILITDKNVAEEEEATPPIYALIERIIQKALQIVVHIAFLLRLQ